MMPAFFCLVKLIKIFDFLDGHDQTQVKYTWRQDQDCRHDCNKVYIYDKDMANFEILEAKKTKEATVYHAGREHKIFSHFIARRKNQYQI